MVKEEEVWKALREVDDPEVGINMVDLGLIYGIEINKGKVKVRMTFTTPLCPLGGLLVENVKERLKKVKGVKDVEVELVFDEPWTPERMSEDARKKLGL